MHVRGKQLLFANIIITKQLYFYFILLCAQFGYFYDKAGFL